MIAARSKAVATCLVPVSARFLAIRQNGTREVVATDTYGGSAKRPISAFGAGLAK